MGHEEKMCRAYVFDDMDNFTDADLAAALEKVSAERRQKALAYVHAADRKQSVIAELLLRHALRDAYGMDTLPDIQAGHHGKPGFNECEDYPRFNLSHCKAAVACAVASDAVGIDVEPYASYDEEVACEVLNDNELATAIGSPARFAEWWTKKESFLKYTGKGLTDHLKSLLAETGGARFHTFHNERGYACTVCSHPAYNQILTKAVDKQTLLNG